MNFQKEALPKYTKNGTTTWAEFTTTRASALEHKRLSGSSTWVIPMLECLNQCLSGPILPKIIIKTFLHQF